MICLIQWIAIYPPFEQLALGQTGHHAITPPSSVYTSWKLSTVTLPFTNQFLLHFYVVNIINGPLTVQVLQS